MKLRNKGTGKIGILSVDIDRPDNGIRVYADDHIAYRMYDSLTELNEEWEDYEEPDEIWYIDWRGGIRLADLGNTWEDEKEIGNCFYSKEEAEKAVEKLKAIKRLKDKGFKFEGIKEDYTRILQSQDPFRAGKRYLQFNKSEDEEWMKENWKDLNICFGGDE